MKRSLSLIFAFAGLSIVTLTLVGCGGPSVEFLDSNAEYTATQARQVLERTDTSELSDELTQQATALRRSALADLRSQGKTAGEAADLITNTFPPGTKSVPVYVERATVNGKPSLVIVEAWGSPEGSLDRKRLWVIERATGDVVYSAASK